MQEGYGNIENTTLQEAPLPCILHWNGNHYVVLYKITRSKGFLSLINRFFYQFKEVFSRS